MEFEQDKRVDIKSDTRVDAGIAAKAEVQQDTKQDLKGIIELNRKELFFESKRVYSWSFKG